jgi:hypothetical protein
MRRIRQSFEWRRVASLTKSKVSKFSREILMRDQGKSSALSGKDRARSCLLQTLQRSRNEQLLPNEAAEYVAIWTRFVIFRLYGPLLSVRTVISRSIAGSYGENRPLAARHADAGDGRRRGSFGVGDGRRLLLGIRDHPYLRRHSPSHARHQLARLHRISSADPSKPVWRISSGRFVSDSSTRWK